MQILITILVFFSADVFAADLYAVGVHDYSFQDKPRKRSIQTHVWYPVDPKTSVKSLNAKGPLSPVVGALNSPLAKSSKQFPVVLLSHGSMGLANRLFWLAEILVKNGFIVIATDHPGNMFGDSSADGVMRVWDRTKDLSFALDEVLKESEFGPHIDSSRVSAVGHSVGGTTVLLLAGGKFSFENFGNPTPECEGSKDPFYEKQCMELKRINIKNYEKSLIEGDYYDKRVKAVVALDPGFARSFKPESLRSLKPRTYVFIADKLAVPQDQIHSRDFLGLLEVNQVEIVPDSVHMTFLAACKSGVPLEDPELKELCANREQKLRIQKNIAQKVLGFFAVK